jgi:hypothetical protein
MTWPRERGRTQAFDLFQANGPRNLALGSGYDFAAGFKVSAFRILPPS